MRARQEKRHWRFLSIKLDNWRNFSRVDVPLGRRVFLLGPNASGKSNFLDALRFLHDLSSVGGGLRSAVERRGGVSNLRCLSARRYPEIGVSVEVGENEQHPLWSYEIRFNQDQQKNVRLTREIVQKEGKVVLSRPLAQDEDDPELKSQTHLEQVRANEDFRELAEFFQTIRYLHVVPQLVREPERSVGRRDDPFGGDLIEQLARVPEKTRNSRLRKVQEALIIAVPQLKSLELIRDPIRGTAHLQGRYEHWRPQGKLQTEEVFSDGTLRLLGLLWAMLESGGPLLLEEPELSLHPAVVRHIPAMFYRMQRSSGRQVLVSTHSADLLRDEGIGLDEVLLLTPGREGTVVTQASSRFEVVQLVQSGLPLDEAVLPLTAPARASQLGLFGA